MCFLVLAERVRSDGPPPLNVVSLFSQEENAVRVVWVNFAVSGHSSFSSGSARA